MAEPASKIHIITAKATTEQIQEMAAFYGSRIKVAVDLKRHILAGGGEWHADCRDVLCAQESNQEDVWGGAYYPDTQQVDFLSHINIRPQQGNIERYIGLPEIRTKLEEIVRERLE